MHIVCKKTIKVKTLPEYQYEDFPSSTVTNKLHTKGKKKKKVSTYLAKAAFS